ncbi:MAG: hypothetical protein J6M16_09530 [Clostridia bacterium]|nr:hypothetical protein [Clostridia bacterium]
MLIQNDYLTFDNGKRVSLAAFALMALAGFGYFGFDFLGWTFLHDIFGIVTMVSYFLIMVGGFLMYNESREIGDIVLCGTGLLGLIFSIFPFGSNWFLSIICNLLVHSYLAAFALSCFMKDEKTNALIFAALLVYTAIVGPVLKVLILNLYAHTFWDFLEFVFYAVKNLNNLIMAAGPAFALLTISKRTLEKTKE